jgi:hypothetical protein
MPTATCDFRFSLQNRHASAAFVRRLEPLRVSNRAVTLSGRATRSEREITEDDFVRAREPEIHARLSAFLDEHSLPRPNDLVILDMEPEDFAPRKLGEFRGSRQRALIAAYARRIKVARQVLGETGLPGLRLGLYQVIVPDGRGRPSPEFRTRMDGYVAAGEQGMYDQLDVICPVLYQRYGPDDAAPSTLARWVAASSRQAIDGSLTLRRKNGGRIPLVPVLSFWVLNGRSTNDRDAVTPRSVARQLLIVQEAIGIMAIVLWSGWQTTTEMENAREPVEAIDLESFLLGVGSLPWPGCT